MDNVVKVRRLMIKFLVQGTKLMPQEYERTGYVWEQYDAVTGEGRRRYESC